MKKILYTMIVLLITAFTVSCTQPTEAPQSTEAPQANEPNPASVYCEEQGYRLEIRTAEARQPDWRLYTPRRQRV